MIKLRKLLKVHGAQVPKPLDLRSSKRHGLQCIPKLLEFTLGSEIKNVHGVSRDTIINKKEAFFAPFQLLG